MLVIKTSWSTTGHIPFWWLNISTCSETNFDFIKCLENPYNLLPRPRPAEGDSIHLGTAVKFNVWVPIFGRPRSNSSPTRKMACNTINMMNDERIVATFGKRGDKIKVVKARIMWNTMSTVKYSTAAFPKMCFLRACAPRSTCALMDLVLHKVHLAKCRWFLGSGAVLLIQLR